MQFYKLTFQGPQTSKTAFGVHFRSGRAVYLTKDELPVTLSALKHENITHEVVESDERPESGGPELGTKGGLVWVGMSPKKPTDYGKFVRDVPRYDLSEEALAHLSAKPGFKKVE